MMPLESARQLARLFAPPMQLGVNYPWGSEPRRDGDRRESYGWDLGDPPYGIAPFWRASLRSDLAHFEALGLRQVRWFLLGDGSHASDVRAIARDFEEVLRLFAVSRVQILPTLLDGQTMAPAVAQRCVKEVLPALLEVTERYPSAVSAWDVCNEPEGFAVDMRAVLHDAARRARRSHPVTIGYQFFDSMIECTAPTDLRSFHYYGETRKGHRAPLPRRPEGRPTWLTEAPTTGDLERTLIACERAGYHTVLLWSANKSRDDATAFWTTDGKSVEPNVLRALRRRRGWLCR